MNALRRHPRSLHLALLALRLLVALTAQSIIHPDEHFQNSEIAATVFDYANTGAGPLRTWEWIGEAPCRSIVPVWATTGAGFAVLKFVAGDQPSARALFYTQRVVFWALSLIVDRVIAKLNPQSWTPSLLFATSPLVFTFLVRPFSNSIETIIFALSIYCLDRLLRCRADGAEYRRWTAILGGLVAVGVWTRVTFLAFMFPLVVAFAYDAATREAGGLLWSRIVVVLRRGFPAVSSCIITSLALSIIDTAYFDPTRLWPPRLIITPLNLLLFNLSTKNLAQHGIHPRYLHVLVNWPMLFGVGLYAVGESIAVVLRAEVEKEKGREPFMRILYLSAFIVPTLLLSIQPHQEPRFLLPLIVPLIMLLSKSSLFRQESPRIRNYRRFFWTIWILHSVILTVMLGYLHQGGVIPSLLRINEELRNGGGAIFVEKSIRGELDLVFWRTFMPPRHLFLPLSGMQPTIRTTDLSGASIPSLLSTLSLATTTSSTTLLIAPAYVVDELSWNPGCLIQLFDRTFGVQADFDELSGVMNAKWDRMGVRIWRVDGGNCDFDNVD